MNKKITLLMAVFFALAACSEDVDQELDQQTSGLEEGYFPDSDGSGGTKPFTDESPHYSSPWDINEWNTEQVWHVFANLTGPDPSIQLIFAFTPYIGLAYYDGHDDGLYHDNMGVVADFNTGLYPNLYANGHEIGNFIPANSIVMNNYGMGDMDFAITSSTTHCPVFDGNAGVSNGGQYFAINPALANPMEQRLLADYGKVFFYKYDIFHPSNPAVVIQSGYVMPLCDETLSLDWYPLTDVPLVGTQISVNIPGKAIPVDLYYHQQYREIIIEHFNGYPHSDPFFYGGETYEVHYSTNLSYTQLLFF